MRYVSNATYLDQKGEKKTMRESLMVMPPDVCQIVAPTHAPCIPWVLRDDYSTTPLTCVNLHQIHNVSWTGLSTSKQPELAVVGGTPRQLYNSTLNLQVFTFFDPWVQAVYRGENSTMDAVYGAAYPTEVAGEGLIDDGVQYAETWSDQQQVITPRIGMLRHLAGTACYGDYHPVGMVPTGDRVFWVDSAADATAVIKLWITLSNVPAAGVFQAFLRKWTGETEWEDSVPVELLATDVTQGILSPFPDHVAPGSGYYSVFVGYVPDGSALSSTGVNVAIQVITSTRTVSRHVYTPKLFSHFQEITTVKCGGSAALLTNPVPEISKGGVIVMVQTAGKRPWYHWSAEGVEALFDETPAADAHRMSWDKGSYHYVRPTPANGDGLRHPLRISDFAKVFQVGPPNILWRPLMQRGYVACEIQPPQVGGSVPPGASQWPTAQAAFIFTMALVFSPTSQWYPTQKQRVLNPVAITDALREAPQFYENPLHWSDIRKFFSKLVPYVPLIGGAALAAKGVSSMDPLSVLAGAGQLIRFFGRSQSGTARAVPAGFRPGGAADDLD